MKFVQDESITPPPGVISSLKAGFDITANHIGIILFPILLDIFLWFGPRLSVNRLLAILKENFTLLAREDLAPAAEVERIQESIKLLMDLDVNLFSLLRTFPIGVSSLMAQALPGNTPLGVTDVQYLDNGFMLVFWIFALTLGGWLLGSLYFTWVAKISLNKETYDLSWAVKTIAQSFFFSVLWTLAIIVLGTPILVIFSIFGQINPTLAQFALIFFALFAMWIIVPFFFSGHGIFTREENLFRSIVNSFKLSRYTLPTSSFFVLGVLLLSQGFNVLWLVPETSSWMMLVGILGHAFITTALLVASFIYYHDMYDWLEILFEKFDSKMTSAQA